MISKETARKAIRFSLLFYPLFVGLMGTISLVVLVFWGIPEHHNPKYWPSSFSLVSSMERAPPH
jgi:hypothetical protein